jgi:hydrogenase maturation protein HypF
MGTEDSRAAVHAVRLLVRGTVQGVGFRPFVFRLAAACGVAGFVENRPDGVRIHAEGPADALASFRARLSAEPPPAARIARVTARAVAAAGHAAFVIAPSRGGGRTVSSIPPDIATCPSCAAETDDPGDRRYRYPFTNCTACGPRFTIAARLPYDRANTSMAPFPLCPACGREYEDPADRRFHAEPVACPACGPALRIADGSGSPVAAGDPVAAAADALKDGRIVALRGLGGFQLACDATSETAVRELRLRKRRGEKPFAVMVRDLGEARSHARLSRADEAILASPAAPVLLCEPDARAPLAPSVAPGIGRLGLFLPYTPLHRLLLAAAGRPLVMTSGNLADEPIATGNDEAVGRLAGVADLFLLHDREVLRRADDSVVASVGGKAYPIRRARGFVPAPVSLRPLHARAVRAALRGRAVAGLGGEMKNAFCFLSGNAAILSQHVGDLSDAGAREAWRAEFDFFRRFLGADVAAVCHDLHPAWFTTGVAEEALPGCPSFALQHHEAHLWSLVAESGFSGKAVGFAFDGTGYGTDGGIWGGEVFSIDGLAMRRVGSLLPFPLQGGDAAARAPWKSALSLLLATLPRAEAEAAACQTMPDVPPGSIALAAEATSRGVNTIACSSAGRLFDGASALCGLGSLASFEGQAAMRLEARASVAGRGGGYPFSLRAEGGLLAIDWKEAVAALVADRDRKAAPAAIARRFHETVAAMILSAASRVASESGARHVLLSGGVFQNLLLLGRLLSGLRALKLTPVIHRQVPCNDGGIALGQAFRAAIKLSEG